MLKVIELFGGIGAVHTALKRLNIPYELIDMVEFDKKVVEAYNLIHGTNFDPQNVLTWDKDLKCDYLHASTPCQAFSIAGKQLGAADVRGAPLWEATIRIIKKTQPKIITLENVKGLLSEKHKQLVNWYVKELNDLGYITQYKLLNAKDFGVPQNRERVFFVSYKKELNIDFMKIFNFKNYEPKYIRDILDNEAQWLSPKEVVFLDKNTLIFKNEMKQYNGHIIKLNLLKAQEKGHRIIKCAEIQKQKWRSRYSMFINKNEISNTIISNNCDFKSKLCDINFNQMKSFNNINAITATLRAGDCNVCEKIIDVSTLSLTIKYRTLTPKECFRLMDFSDEQFDKVKHFSTSRLTKLAGNSIVVECIKAILENIKKYLI